MDCDACAARSAGACDGNARHRVGGSVVVCELGAGLIRQPAGAILAGGRSSRLGGVDKGLLEVGGRRIIDRIADALAPLTSELLIVSSAPDAGGWRPGDRVVRDVLTGGGSAAGVHAALVEAARPVIVVAWDLPFVDARVLRELLRDADEAGVDAVVPEGVPDHAFEPLCGWYAPACAGHIARAWQSGDRSLHALLRAVRTRVVPRSRLAALDGAEHLFLNVNTPDDLRRACSIADARSA